MALSATIGTSNKDTFEFARNLVHNHYIDWGNRIPRGIYDPVPYRLNKCQAWYSGYCYDPQYDVHYNVLQSYGTPVAVYVMEDDAVYRFGKWSNTTTQHQRKFKKETGATYMIDVGSNGLYRGWR